MLQVQESLANSNKPSKSLLLNLSDICMFLKHHKITSKASVVVVFKKNGYRPTETPQQSPTPSASGEVLLNFRVALASQCITDASKRPTEPRPEALQPVGAKEKPWRFFTRCWTCVCFHVVCTVSGFFLNVDLWKGICLLRFLLSAFQQINNELRRYLMPETLRERPFWDCTSFPSLGPTFACGWCG